MMLRTHTAITILAILLFLPHISHDFTFIAVALIATALPDVDSAFSTFGKLFPSRIIQFFVKHRGFLHSFTFCLAVSFLFAVFYPVIALPFFVGYGLHLFADSFTPEGIKPFWPSKQASNWKVSTGGRIETTIFVFFVVIDLLVFLYMIKSAF